MTIFKNSKIEICINEYQDKVWLDVFKNTFNDGDYWPYKCFDITELKEDVLNG